MTIPILVTEHMLKSHFNKLKLRTNLVGGFNPSEIYEFVNWDDDIPNIWPNHPVMFQSPPTSNHQPNIIYQVYSLLSPYVHGTNQIHYKLHIDINISHICIYIYR